MIFNCTAHGQYGHSQTSDPGCPRCREAKVEHESLDKFINTPQEGTYSITVLEIQRITELVEKVRHPTTAYDYNTSKMMQQVIMDSRYTAEKIHELIYNITKQ